MPRAVILAAAHVYSCSLTQRVTGETLPVYFTEAATTLLVHSPSHWMEGQNFTVFSDKSWCDVHDPRIMLGFRLHQQKHQRQRSVDTRNFVGLNFHFICKLQRISHSRPYDVVTSCIMILLRGHNWVHFPEGFSVLIPWIKTWNSFQLE